MTSLDRLFYALFIAGILGLGFVAGALSVHSKSPLNDLIRESIEASSALLVRDHDIEKEKKAYSNITLVESRATNNLGAYQGYTLYLPKSGPRAILLDMEGRVIHRWDKPFRDVWPGSSHIKKPLPEASIYLEDAHLFKNGDILVTYAGFGDTPYGYGLAKLDVNGNVIWRFNEHVHHRFHVSPKGEIYLLVNDLTKVPSDPAFNPIKNKTSRILYEWLVVLSPDGKELARISLFDAIINSAYLNILMDRFADNNRRLWDVMRSNSVDVLTPIIAEHFPMFKPGQVLISFRQLNAIAVVDLIDKKIIWAMRGNWKFQHDAEFIDDGTIMLFDNQGKNPKESRILKVNPKTGLTTVVYQGNKKKPFFSRIRGIQQPLPNGNVLITESERGRVLEVNSKQEIVWEFINPYRTRSRPIEIIVAKRYSATDLSFITEKKY